MTAPKASAETAAKAEQAALRWLIIKVAVFLLVPIVASAVAVWWVLG